MRSLACNGAVRTGERLSTTWEWWSSEDDTRRCTASIGLELDFGLPPGYRLRYGIEREGSDREVVDIRGGLLRTTPTYGGSRWWFACPRCGMRVRVLYLPGGSTRFACRSCHHLRYRCQRETLADRLLRRSRKLYRRAGSDGGESSSFVYKPKGMHQRTFNRLMDAAEHYEIAAFNAVPIYRSILRRLHG